MNLYLHQKTCGVFFDYRSKGFSQFSFWIGDRSELHSLLLSNSSGVNYNGIWDYCFPTPFGWGLAADWMEDNSALILERCQVNPYTVEKTASEVLSLVIAECRRLFAEAAGR